MAEVASVFGEMLVIDKILPTLSEEERTGYLASNIEGMFSTMFRQNMIARFEISSHNLIEQNGSASWKELAELYKKELEIMFGDSVIIPKEYYYEWSSIPHIFRTPFYVYAYNFANLLVLALYQQYKVEGKSFVPKYKELLRSGAKDSPKELLKKIGIDISNKDFWEKGFEFIEREFISKLD
jgi:oligoendopeptidase F